jgi:hypothetical protein
MALVRIRIHFQSNKYECSVIDTVRKIWHHMRNRLTNRVALAAFKENIYQKHICSRIVLPCHYKNIYRVR